MQDASGIVIPAGFLRAMLLRMHNTPRKGLDGHDGAEERKALLQRLLPLWPREIADGSLANRQRIIRLLARALREERRRGSGGHWAYDLSRHAALAKLYKQECEALRHHMRRR